MWSLGVIFYMMLCGEPPFSGKNHKVLIRNIKRAEYSMDKPQFDKCSDEAIDLLKKILVKNPHERLTAAEAYSHAWIRREIKKENLNMVIDPNVFGELESFMKSFTLKKVLLLRIASQIPENEVTTLKNIFKKIDTNGNGLISKEEMVAGMKEFASIGMSNLKEKTVKKLFHAMDLDHNGEIGYTEFIASFMNTHLES